MAKLISDSSTSQKHKIVELFNESDEYDNLSKQNMPSANTKHACCKVILTKFIPTNMI